MKECNKIAYKHRVNAWKWAIYHFKMFGTRTGIYRCRYCKKYHLSRKCGFTPVKRLLTNQ